MIIVDGIQEVVNVVWSGSAEALIAGALLLAMNEMFLLRVFANPIDWYDRLTADQKSIALGCALRWDIATFAQLLSQAVKNQPGHARKPLAPVQVDKRLFVRSQSVLA